MEQNKVMQLSLITDQPERAQGLPEIPRPQSGRAPVGLSPTAPLGSTTNTPGPDIIAHPQESFVVTTKGSGLACNYKKGTHITLGMMSCNVMADLINEKIYLMVQMQWTSL